MNVLNSSGVGRAIVGSVVPDTPEELGKYLQKAMLRIKADHISMDGRGVDYASLASSKAFSEYVDVTQQLVNCDLTALSEKERMAFFISILRTYERGRRGEEGE